MRIPAATVVEREVPGRISASLPVVAKAATVRCKHCGLVVSEERRSSPFCCAGCEAVAGLLQQEGLQQFYLLGGGSLGSVGSVPRKAVLDWLPEQEQKHRLADGTVCLPLDVQGLRCAACVWLLQEVWKRQVGALALRVDPSMGRALLVYRSEHGTAGAFLERTARLGYPMAPATRTMQRDTSLLLRLGICSALAMNAMILAVSQYCGLGESDPALDRLFSWVALALATGSVVVGGPVFFKAAISGLRTGVVHMDLPISLGLLLAYAGSIHGQFTGTAMYYDTVAMFTALMLGGRFLQQRSLQRGRDQVLADDGAEHLRVRRLEHGSIESCKVTAVEVGDELVLAPGDLVPVRCRLLTEASCSLDWINGESEPRAFAANDSVPAGAFVASRRAVRMVAEATYLDSGLAELLSQPPPDREDPHGRVRFWQRLARSYVLGVLLLAALAAAMWSWIDPQRSLPVAISLLVITCPCAFGLAAPLAFHLALSGLRRQGIFVRTRSLLDKLARVRKVVFDKTGTVTHGGLSAKVVQPAVGSWRSVLLTMAASSNHPASQAVLQAMASEAAHAGTVFDGGLLVEEIPGGGLQAEVAGRVVRLGSPSFTGIGPISEAGRECVLASAGEVLARYVLEEDFRIGVREEVAMLRARGLQVHLLSGDRKDRVATAAHQLGIDAAAAHGEMAPEQKAAFVRALDDDDTLMVGDGINDAPAFAAAFCAGTPAMDRPVLPHRADFFFRGANAGAVSAVLALADRYRKVTRTNLALALLYNTSTVVLAFTGHITPLACAVLMPLSSIALIALTSARLAHEGGRR
jgi:Cu2+-exporting ATPase